MDENIVSEDVWEERQEQLARIKERKIARLKSQMEVLEKAKRDAELRRIFG